MPESEDNREEESRGEKEKPPVEDPEGEEEDVVFLPPEETIPTPRRSTRKRKSIDSAEPVEERKETPVRKIKKSRNMASTMRSPGTGKGSGKGSKQGAEQSADPSPVEKMILKELGEMKVMVGGIEGMEERL